MNIPTQETMVANILRTYNRALPGDVATGLEWYPEANRIMREWSHSTGRSVANVAAVTAALSPQLRWERNLILADDLIHGREPSINGVIRTNWDKASALYTWQLEDTRFVFKQGPKVHNFSHNLEGDYSYVTVDTHAAEIAAGMPLAGMSVGTEARYNKVVQAYRAAGQESGLSPAMIQAVTWVTWKRMYPHKQSERRKS